MEGPARRMEEEPGLEANQVLLVGDQDLAEEDLGPGPVEGLAHGTAEKPGLEANQVLSKQV